MKDLIEPHGGRLINRVIENKDFEYLRNTNSINKIVVNSREISDIELIAVGAFSPLEGFICRDDYESIIENKRLKDGLPWTIPITLSVSKDKADEIKIGEDVALADSDNNSLAILHVEDKYNIDREREATKVYGTKDLEHPGVKYIYNMGEILLGGKIDVLKKPEHTNFIKYRHDPAETRQIFHKKGWKRVVGFQTRNPIHRAHEYIQKCALEIVDGLFLHPIVGDTKEDDIPAETRMKCYDVLLKNYFPKDRVVLCVLPAAMRYAGPREAIFHAIVRKNYGCTHFIVGRDHAGVGNYYGSFDAHKIFDEFDSNELGITPLFFDYTFYCKLCNDMVSYKTCPHDKAHHITLSGTKVREMLRHGKMPPSEFTRPEVAKILIEDMTK